MTRSRYAVPAIVLHWLIAGLIVAQVVLAGRMEDRTPEAFAVLQLHKSVGISILLLSLVRLGWRLANPPPPMPQTLKPWERRLARITHAGFYVIMIGMPLTGWVMVSASRLDIPTLLFGVVPWPHLPLLPGLAPAAREMWRELGEQGHELLLRLAYLLIALHVSGALKHQLFSRDEPVLARMAPGARPGRRLEPRLLLIALLLAGAAALGLLVEPPRPGVAPPPLPESAEGQAPLPAVAAAPADAGPVRWIKAEGSSLRFTSAWSGQEIEGRFGRWTADISFSPAALDRSRVTVGIDLTSVESGDPQRDAGVQASDFLDVGAHPKATFTATRFEHVKGDRYVAHGTLNLRGVEGPLALPFRLDIGGDRARVRGVTSLDRTAYGVGQGEWASTDQIPAKVTIRVDLKARRG